MWPLRTCVRTIVVFAISSGHAVSGVPPMPPPGKRLRFTAVLAAQRTRARAETEHANPDHPGIARVSQHPTLATPTTKRTESAAQHPDRHNYWPHRHPASTRAGADSLGQQARAHAHASARFHAHATSPRGRPHGWAPDSRPAAETAPLRSVAGCVVGKAREASPAARRAVAMPQPSGTRG